MNPVRAGLARDPGDYSWSSAVWERGSGVGPPMLGPQLCGKAGRNQWPFAESGAMTGERNGKQWFMRFGAVGSPDIFAMRKSVYYGIDVRAEKGRQSDAQKEFPVRFEAAGGVYILAKHIEDVEKAI